MKFKLIAAAAFVTAMSAFAGHTAFAQSASAPAAAQAVMTEGEVRKIDLATQKLTLKHGEISNLGMAGMTMVFKVSDPKLLESVKEGQKVRFHAERVNGAITVTAIEPAAQ